MLSSNSAAAAARGDVQAINLWWLLRLRWVAIIGQIAIILGVDWLLAISLPRPPLFAIVGFEVASNGVCALWARHAPRVTDAVVAGILAVDVVLLTALLYLTGGPVNPFSFLYLVHIALAAVTLRPRHTWALTALCVLGFGMLFLLPAWSSAGGAQAHADHLQMHLQGMYVAFAIAAVLIVYFVQRVTQALSEREAELAAARRAAERHDKFESLATLAAGAAHELATPLSTIAVAARELERGLEKCGDDAISDVQLIRAQVKRCHEILQQLAADVGQGSGEHPTPTTAIELLELALGGVRDRDQVIIDSDATAGSTVLEVPRRALGRALRGIIKNAQQASAATQPVRVGIRYDANQVRFEICDQGAGMTPEVLEHAGEPFFTTKAPGEGMGLGLFLARTIVARLGGRLEIASQPRHGSTVCLILPAVGAGRRPEPAALSSAA